MEEMEEEIESVKLDFPYIFNIPEYKSYLAEKPDENMIETFDNAIEDLYTSYQNGDVDLFTKAKDFQSTWCAEREESKESGVGTRRLYYPKDAHAFRYLNFWYATRDSSDTKDTQAQLKAFIEFFTENSYENM